MKIGVILNPYGEKNPSGMGVFVKNLVDELIKCDDEDTFYLFTKGKHDTSVYENKKNVKVFSMPKNIFWKDVALLKHPDVDVWLYNNLGMPLVLKPKKSLAVALDFWSSHEKKSTTLRESAKSKAIRFTHHLALKRATLVSCISEATKKDLHGLFPDIPKDKVLVNMCGFTKVCKEYEGANIKNLPNDYYLVVGVMKPRKNQLTAVRAYFKAKDKGMKSKLVIVGKGVGTYYEQIMDEINSSKHKEDVIYFGYASNEQLVTLYKNARALIFPSHFEGFGMPVLETMSCGVPVIASSNGSVGEIAQDSAVTVDSSDVDGFTEAIISLRNEELRNDYIEKGLKRADDFSWQKNAKEYINILRSL